MRKLFGLTAFALILSLAACDSSTGSSATASDGSTGVKSDLVGSWKATTTFSLAGYSAVDVEWVTLSSNGAFKRIQDVTNSMAGYPANATMDTTMGTWSASATKLILSDSTGTDTASYTLSGSNLTVVLPVQGMLDTLKFVRQ